MELVAGSVVTGKVTGITSFGAFVSLPEARSGMVHISEISNTYVEDIRQHLQEGQEVQVKILGKDDNGRINLSIKKAMPRPEPVRGNAPPVRNRPPTSLSFEDKLKQFMQSSESKPSDRGREKRTRRTRGGDWSEE